MSKQNHNAHEKIEKNIGLMAILIAVAVSFGGLAEIVPLMFQAEAVKPLPGVKPYPALELAGRDIYIREGCYNCHSQMIRSLRDEVERYGHYSLAAESMYDKPFQWGSKRNGPDLARVGNKYSDDWQRQHLDNPRNLVPGSIMPGYQWLAKTELDKTEVLASVKILAFQGQPYTPEMIENAEKDLITQASVDSPDADALAKRYPKAQARKFSGVDGPVNEADALIAYLQMLGTLVDFKIYDSKANLR